MRLAIDANRRQLLANVEKVLASSDGVDGELRDALNKAKELFTALTDEARINARKIQSLLPTAIDKATGEIKQVLRKIRELDTYFVDKSVWAFGGDGWAYDIGFGGLDHVMAMNRNVNILVMDTDVYSNTGGQASKATPLGSVARFAESGKKTIKKDLGLMMMSYGYVYVANVAMGANKMQFIRAVTEAEAYDGPAIIIAYAPCINHGINMAEAQIEQKRAVDAGYWMLYRYNPALKAEGKNPFILDSKEPTADLKEFLAGEKRYSSLKTTFPDKVDAYWEKATQFAKERYEFYKNFAGK